MEAASSPPNPGATVRASIEAIAGTIRLARELVESQRMVDLTGLDEEVALLCARAFDLPPADGRRLLPDLNRLAAAVNALTASLEHATGQPG